MPKPQTFRLQFSLRFLLIAMALVGVSIVVYRWPWTVVVEKHHQFKTTTRYHRSWNGKPVKDGLEVERLYQGIVFERWFVEGEVRTERILKAGVTISEASYRGGKLSGPYWGVGSQSRAEGEYLQGLLHGTWTYTRVETIDRGGWQLGKRHGRRTWTTPAGRLLQSAEYDGGDLVRWNDQPIDDELVRWLNAEVHDSDLRQRFLQPIQQPENAIGEVDYYGEVIYSPRPGRTLTVHWATIFPKGELGQVGRPLGEAILADALEHSHTIARRFNSLHVVPITVSSLDWQDRTGVDNVQFEPDSQQAQAWLKSVSPNPFARDPDQRFEDMFSPTSETGITLDTTAITKPEPPAGEGALLGGGSLPGYFPKFPRRDLLGKHLDREGCFCEQRGNTLIIKRLE